MTASGFDLRWAAGTHDLEGALRVRERVFCCEQGVPREEELDGRDDDALHLLAVARENERVIGTLRLFIGGGEAKISRVAVERDWRRHGVASSMLAAALALAGERACTRARLASQLEATAIYARAGFSVESEPFEEAGMTHVWMGRPLNAPAEASPDG